MNDFDRWFVRIAVVLLMTAIWMLKADVSSQLRKLNSGIDRNDEHLNHISATIHAGMGLPIPAWGKKQ